ncbi:GNAT family N-acetyltransferase [Niveispirillum sp.]|uniref:GNAT family N-acetyltransferase n=1 Tax=Niveispirillum sp. TaxID=1917217 RepID=UPI001B58BE6F|nr:GNAT family N-acetyltransferase [Niveispirillum sp.]MBP7335326.1 GNAT family N-acetyltransferase [Niveispirillum sp.]
MNPDPLAVLMDTVEGMDVRIAAGGDRTLVRQIIGADAAHMLASVPASARTVLISVQVESRLPTLSRHHPLATLLLLGEDGRAVGMMMVDWPPAGPVTLLDLTLLPGLRRHGRGTRVLTALCGVADRFGRPLRASLFYDDPAQRFLALSGFAMAGSEGTDIVMERPPGPGI